MRVRIASNRRLRSRARARRLHHGHKTFRARGSLSGLYRGRPSERHVHGRLDDHTSSKRVSRTDITALRPGHVQTRETSKALIAVSRSCELLRSVVQRIESLVMRTRVQDL